MKRYKCLSKDYDDGKMLNNMYDANYTCGGKSFNVSEIAEEYPNEWELVEDDFILPEKWQLNDMNDRCNCYFSSSDIFFTLEESPSLLNWNCSREIFAGHTEITFEQFKKYVLKQNVMGKEIIGYKLKEDCKQFEQAAILICRNQNSAITNLREGNLYAHVAKDWLKTANVFDLWFEPVYKEDKKLPKINNYEGEYDAKNNVVKYGCVHLKVPRLRDFYSCRNITENRSITLLRLDSNVDITMNQIKEILEYVDSQK